MKNKLSKVEAAGFLGVSERAVERYTRAGRLTPETVDEPSKSDGRIRPHNYYSADELKRLKQEMESGAANGNTHHAAAAPATALVLRSPAGADFLARLVEGIGEKLRAVAPPAPACALENKLTLSLKEAAAVAGLSRGYLLEAVKAGKLKAAKRGRGWNIKKKDLQAFIDKL